MSYLIFAHLGSFWDIVPSFVISQWCTRLSQRRKRGFHKQYKSSRMAAIWNEEERRKKNKTKIQIYVCRKREAVMHSLSKRHYRHTVYGSFSPVSYSDNFGLFLNLDLKTMRLDYYDEVRYDTLFHVTYLPIFDKPLLPLYI